MTTHSHSDDSAHQLTVVYADFQVRQPKDVGPISELNLALWPRQICDAANDSRLLLQRELIDLAQRNLNANFSFLRRLTGAKNLGEMIEMQVAHVGNRLAASVGQSEELLVLSIKAVLGFARGIQPGRAHN